MLLTMKVNPAVPLEAPNISPTNLLGKSAREVATIPLLYGNEEAPLGDFFSIDAAECSGRLHLEGNLSRVKYVGQNMNRGLLTIDGPVGMHLGADMLGGEIRVKGEVDDWLGAGMRGGLIKVTGQAGHMVGANCWGEKMGMTGGTIIIDGDAGNEVGAKMRRGLVVVTGNCGDFPGTWMKAGTVAVLGRSGAYPGANMKRGTIILADAGALLPTFAYCCLSRPIFLPILWRTMENVGVSVPRAFQEGQFIRYLGDTNELGKGEILVCQRANAG